MQLDNIYTLKNGGVGIAPADTIYGIFASALNPKVIEHLYDVVKGRDKTKPFIILISKFEDLEIFNIKINDKVSNFLKKVWPGKVSVVLECNDEKFTYLHRGKRSLAFRVPDRADLVETLSKTGPLVSTSANLEGEPTITTIDEAKKIFGDKVDFYEDGGEIISVPSTIVTISNDELKIIRMGASSEIPKSL